MVLWLTIYFTFSLVMIGVLVFKWVSADARREQAEAEVERLAGKPDAEQPVGALQVHLLILKHRIATLQELNRALAARLAAQAELLSRRSETRPYPPSLESALSPTWCRQPTKALGISKEAA